MANNKYNNNVTEKDYEFIKSNYQNMTVKEIAEKLGKKTSYHLQSNKKIKFKI